MVRSGALRLGTLGFGEVRILSKNKIPLSEQVEELGTEYLRRCQAYPLLIAAGQMREVSAELKIERIASAYNTLCWLLKHADDIKEWLIFTKSVSSAEERAAIEFDAPMEVEGGEGLSDKQEAAE